MADFKSFEERLKAFEERRVINVDVQVNDKSLHTAEERMKNLEQTANRVSNNIQDSVVGFMRIGNTLRRVTSDYAQLIQQGKEYQKDLEWIHSEYVRIKQQRDDMAQSGITVRNLKEYEALGEELERLQEEYRAVEAETQKLNATMAKMEEKGFGSAYSRSYAEIKGYIEAIEAEIKQRKLNLVNSENVDADIAKIKELESELKKLNQIQTEVQSAQGGQSKTSAWGQDLLSVFQGLGSVLKTVAGGAIKAVAVSFSKVAQGVGLGVAKIHEFGMAIAKVSFQAIITCVKAFASAISSMASGIASASGALAKFTAGGIHLLAQGAQKGAEGLVKLGSSGFNLVKAGAEKAGNAVRGLLQHFKSLGGDASKKLMKSFTSIKSMLMRRVKRTFIGAIFNQAKEGLHSLAKQSKEFNQAMSNIKNSAKGASGNLAVFFGNLITTVEPILTRIINLISKVISYINALFAILSGSKTMMVAKKGTDDYAKSLNKASGSAENAMGKFDELNVIGKDSGGGNAGQIEYEQKEIADILPTEIQKMYDDLFDAIKKQQWEEAGKVVGTFANTIIDTLDSKLIEWREVTTKWAQIAGEFLNGLVEGLDFNKVGKLIGDGINLITDTLNTFLTTFNFEQFGSKLADEWNGIFGSVEFGLLGTTIANVLNSVWETINGFVSNLNFAQIGSKIAEGISSLADTINFDTISHAIYTGINGISDLIHNLVDNVDLTELAERFGSSVSDIFTNIKWEELGDGIGSGISGIFESINALIMSIDFEALGTGLADGLMGLINSINWETIGTTFANYYNSLFTIIESFVDEINFSEIAQKLSDGINGFINSIDWTKLAEAVVTGINKLIPAFRQLVTGVDWVKLTSDLAYNLNSIVSGVRWSALGSTLASFINTAFSVINTFLTKFNFKTLGENLGKGFMTIIDTVEWGNIGETVSGFVNATFSAISGFVSQIEWDKIGQSLNELVAGFNDSVEWETISGAISGSINGLIIAFNEIVTSDTMINLASNLGQTVGNILSDIDWASLATDIGLGIGQLVQAFGTFIADLDLPNIAIQLADGVNAFFDPSQGGANWDSALEAVTTGANNIIEAFKNFVTNIDFPTISQDISNSINTLITEVDWADLIATVLNLGIDLYTAFWQTIADIDFVSLGQQLVDGINSFFSDDKGNLDSSKFESLGKNFGEAIKGILEGIDTFIQDIDLDKIVQAISTYISAIDWTGIAVDAITGIGNAIGKAVSALPAVFKGIIEFIKQIDWLEVAKAILSALANVLVSAVESVGGILATLYKAIFGGNEDVEVPEVFSEKTKRELREQMGDAGEAMAKELEETLVDNVGQMGEDHSSAKQAFLSCASLIGLGFQDKFESTMKEWNVDDATTASMAMQANAIFNACKADDATVNSIKETFYASGITITDGLAEALLGVGSENVATALQLMALGVDQETISALDLTNINANLTNYMNETGASITEVAQALGEDVGGSLGETIPNAVKEALKLGEKEVEATAQEVASKADTSESYDTAGANAEKTAKNVTGTLESEIESGATDVAESAETVTTSVEEKFEALPDEVKPYAESMMNYIISGIENGDPLVQEAIGKVVQEIVDKAQEVLSSETGAKITQDFLDGLSKGVKDSYEPLTAQVKETIGDTLTYIDELFEKADSKTVGTKFIQGLSDGIKEMQETLSTQAEETLDAMLVVFSNALNQENGEKYGTSILFGVSSGMKTEYDSNVKYEAQDIGDNLLFELEDYINFDKGWDIAYYIMLGLARGLAENKGAVVSIAQTVAQNLVSAMKKELQIKSPSRAFAEIGDYTMQGLQMGLEGQEKSVLSTVGDIASAITEEGKNASFDASMGAMTDGLDSATSKLAQIAIIFNDIASALSEMGGLNVPTIAKGQVVPYKTRVSDVSQISEILEALPTQSNSEELVPLLVEQNRLLREILDKPFSVALNPSAMLGRTVLQSERMYAKQTGG